MPDRMYNALFLCKGNSARSIIAEAYLNSQRARHLRGFSAGAQPRGHMHPMALDVIKTLKLSADGLRSKSWDEFARPGAAVMDLIINLCDESAGEECPTWPGQPVTSRWGIPDPAAVQGSEAEQRAAFLETVRYLRRRIDILVNFGMDKLDKVAIKRLDEIGRRDRGEHGGASALR
jgi:protein-tyrosine-phosphatase